MGSCGWGRGGDWGLTSLAVLQGRDNRQALYRLHCTPTSGRTRLVHTLYPPFSLL